MYRNPTTWLLLAALAASPVSYAQERRQSAKDASEQQAQTADDGTAASPSAFDPRTWRAGLAQAAFYPGVDISAASVPGRADTLSVLLTVAAGADPAAIHLDFPGASDYSSDSSDRAILRFASGDVALLKPGIWQQRRDDSAGAIVGSYRRVKGGVTIAVTGRYDKGEPLYIRFDVMSLSAAAGRLDRDGNGRVDLAELAADGGVTDLATAANVSATKTAAFTTDTGTIGQANSGDVLKYTITVGNSGSSDATSVAVADTPDANTTEVTNSINVSPLAGDDFYNFLGAAPTFSIPAASGILANDHDFPFPFVGSPAASFALTAASNTAGPQTPCVSFPCVRPTDIAGASVSLNADGSFDYTRGGPGVVDGFIYTITDGGIVTPSDPPMSGTGKVTISLCPTITVTNPATTTGTIDAAFNQSFTQLGGALPVTFSTASALPAGLSLSAAGVLSGTPTGPGGTFPITVTVTDTNGCTGTGVVYNLTINCQTITVNSPATTTATVDAPFSQSFTQTGVGTHTPATFTLNSGTLPAGITLSAAGLLSGAPTVTGSFPITVKVTDANGCTGISAIYTLVVGCQTITVTNPATTTGTIDAAFSQTFTQTGVGTHTPATFTLNSGTLPAGLTLSSAGVLSGTPTVTGSFPITVKVTDANGCTGISTTYTLVINCQTITVTKPVTTTGTVDAAFSQTFTQAGAHGTATFTTASTLPAGLSLSTAGVLSGTPTQSGSFPIVVIVTDSNGCTGTSSTYTLVINCQTITVTSPGVSTGTVDAPFSQTFTQTAAHGTATFTLNSGSLPSGVTLSTAGVLSGTPLVPGSFPITVKVTDSNGCTGISATYTLVVACQTITVTNPATTPGTVDAAFSRSFTQTGVGTHTPANFTLNSGSLPPGLTLSTAGVLSGTPSAPGTFNFTVKVTDANGCTGIGSTYTIVINCQTITVTNPGVTTGTVDAAFSQTFTQTGVGTHTPANFTTASTLPPGLTLSTAGVLSGTPTAPGTFPITVTVTDANGCTGTSSTYTLVIACQTLTVTNPGVSLATYNTAFSQTFTHTPDTHTPLVFTLASGSLPAGITLASGTGVLSGTPTVTGTFPITVKMTDVNGCFGTSATYNLQVQPKLVADAYSTVGNTQLFVTGVASPPTAPPAVASGTTLLANDTADVTIVTSAGTAPTKGVVTIDGTGHFIYTPNVNATGTDVFTYSGTTNGVTATASITITLNSMVWWVDNATAAGTNDGRSNTPFKTMTAVNSAATNAGDFIYVFKGSGNTTGNYTMKTNQQLIGGGATLSVPTVSPLVTIAGVVGNRPTLAATTGSTLTLADGNTVAGLNVSNTAGSGITGSAVGTLVMAEFDVTVTGGSALSLTTSGTVTATGADNDLSSTNGTALNVANVTIGAAGLTFKSIASGASTANGIILSATGATGGLTVTGNGGTCTSAATCTGGTISNKTGANGSTTQGTGIFLSSTSGVSLAAMQLNDFDNFAIRGTNVTGFSLTNSHINGVNGNNNASGGEEGSIRFDNLFTSGVFPTAQITNSSISGGGTFNLFLNNQTSGSTLNRLMLSNDTFGLISATIGNDNVDVYAQPTPASNNPTVNVTLQDCTFLGTRSDFFETIADGNSTMDVVVRRNKFTNGQAVIPGGGVGVSIRGDSVGTSDNVTFDVSCNNLVGGHKVVGMFHAKGNGGGSWSGATVNNVIGPEAAGSGSDGLFIRSAGAGTVSELIKDNSISGFGNDGVHFQNNDGSSTMNMTMFGNVVSAPHASAFAGLFADNGATAGPPADTNKINLVVGSAGTAALQNTLAGSGPVVDVSLSNFNAGTDFNLSKNGSAAAGGNGASLAQVTQVIQDDNVGSPSVDTSGGAGPIDLVATLPTVPATPVACTVVP